MSASSSSSTTSGSSPSKSGKSTRKGPVGMLALPSRPEFCGKTTELHRAVFARDYGKVAELIANNKEDAHAFLDGRDSRGNSAMHIAAHWGDLRLINMLAAAGARLDPSDAGWSVIQEAAASGMKEAMERLYVLGMQQARTMLENRAVVAAQELVTLPDFYMEIHWSFSTWVPLISRFFPSDTYRVWKIGSQVRVDTTLIGFEGGRFKTGNNSLLFTGVDPKHPHECIILNRVEKTSAFISDNLNPDDATTRDVAVQTLIGGKRSLSARKIEGDIYFTPATGFFGGSKDEVISGWPTKKYRSVGFTYRHTRRREMSVRSSGLPRTVKDPSNFLSADAYFVDPPLPFEKGEGLNWPEEIQLNETKTYEANIWITDQFPLTVTQLLPLFRAMTPLSEQFTRLEEFIALQFPPGFPVKFELPGIYYIITGSVRFANYRPIALNDPD
ncbi:MAG: hypothetical protein Q8P67_16270, partial [archaeon]|nr:hypothetical protein [archaeon]